jgi:hypothetical protein
MAIWQDLISDHGFAGSYQTNPHARSPSVVQRIGPIIAVRNFWWELSKQRAIRPQHSRRYIPRIKSLWQAGFWSSVADWKRVPAAFGSEVFGRRVACPAILPRPLRNTHLSIERKITNRFRNCRSSTDLRSGHPSESRAFGHPATASRGVWTKLAAIQCRGGGKTSVSSGLALFRK